MDSCFCTVFVGKVFLRSGLTLLCLPSQSSFGKIPEEVEFVPGSSKSLCQKDTSREGRGLRKLCLSFFLFCLFFWHLESELFLDNSGIVKKSVFLKTHRQIQC